ncbi:MAG: glycosyltransferase family 39 protein [Thermoanaerobaculia bacterium]
MTAARSTIALFLVITALAAFVRLPVLKQGLWEDEATAVYVAESPNAREFLRRQAAIDYSPPLFNALLAGYGRVLGFGEVPVKALAIALGAVVCGAVAAAAAELFGPIAGLLAGLFAAENRVLIDMSAEVRPYSLSAALAALSMWAVFRFQRRRRSGRRLRGDGILPFVLFVLTSMSHYAGTVAVGAIGVFAMLMAFGRKNRRLWLPIAGCAAAAGVLFLPWLPIVWRQVHIGFPWAGAMRPGSVRSIFEFKALSLLPGMPASASRWAIFGLALALAAFLASSGGVRAELRRRAAPLGLLALAIAGPFFAVGLKAPPVRYITVPVALSMILCGGLMGITVRGARATGLWEHRIALAAVVVMAACSARQGLAERAGAAAAARAGVPKTILRGFFRDGVLRKGDLVIGAPDMIGPTLWYYAPPGVVVRGFVHWSEPAFENFGDYAELWRDPTIVDRCLAALDDDVRSHAVRRVVLVWAVGGDGKLPFRTRIDQLREGIRRRFSLVSTNEFTGPGERIRIDVFETSLDRRRLSRGDRMPSGALFARGPETDHSGAEETACGRARAES